ncbi:MFS-type transporter SLC18B1-like [Octopus sinensis]|uniref:MFS-type transporter SLC18B1-like n=1 Tax=Octopus sinensis TaxID=2607531 RepID=A0A7E6F1Z1_9MOLL|nr:MFS-type transporter SLC18B1-like [Octopus sinensis]
MEIMRNSEEVPDNNDSATNEISDTPKKIASQQKLLITALLLSRYLSASVFPLLEVSYPVEAKLRGINNTLMSLLFGVYPFMNVLAPQMVKRMVYHFELKRIIYVAIGFSAINTIFFGFLEYIPKQGSYNMVFLILSFIVRAFESLSCGTINTAVMIFYTTEFPDDFSCLFGLFMAVTGLGYSTSPLFGGILYDLGGFNLPYLIYGALLAICLPCDIYLLRRSSNKKEERSSVSRFTYSWEIFNNVLLLVVLTLPYAFQEVFLWYHLKDFSFSQTEIGVMYLLLSISYSLASLLNARIVYKISDSKSLLIVSNIILVSALLLCGPSPFLGIEHKYIWLDVVAILLFGYFYNLSSVIIYRLICKYVCGDKTEQTLHESSTISSTFNTSVYFGQLTGFIVAGPILDIFGYRWSLTHIAFLVLLTTLILTYQILSKYLPKIEDFRKLWSNKDEGKHLLNSNTHQLHDRP